jgi:hypothetical protein
MAGFDNEVLYAIGERLQSSSAQAIGLMQQLSSDVARINHVGDPEGVVAANPSSLSHDPVSGNVYIKVSGTGTTLWEKIPTGPSSLTWNIVTSATNPNSLVTSNGYIPKGAGVVVFILPAAAAVGDTFRIAGYGNLWTLTQNAGQLIFMGNQTTTAGVGGSLEATQIKDTAEIVCVTANTEFHILSSMGNITVK